MKIKQKFASYEISCETYYRNILTIMGLDNAKSMAIGESIILDHELCHSGQVGISLSDFLCDNEINVTYLATTHAQIKPYVVMLCPSTLPSADPPVHPYAHTTPHNQAPN